MVVQSVMPRAAERLVEVDGEAVPVQHLPVEAVAAARLGRLGDALEQGKPEALTPKGRTHVQVF